jgi:glycosyltransferase involved in cell wall biosynthesis
MSRSIVVPERSWPRRKKGKSRAVNVLVGLSSRLRTVRISLADPVSYTLPYDRSLAEALARRGHEVDLFTARFPFAELPPPNGYRQHDVFFRHSGRLLRDNPRSRLRFVTKGLEYVPSARRLQREVARIDPDVLHVQWLGLPRYDLRWLKAVQSERPVVFTAHDVLPRRTADKLDLWRQVFRTVDRVVVHGAGAVEQIAGLGVDRGRIVRIPHPVFTPAREIAPPTGPTLLFFGLIRRSKGLDLLIHALPAIAAHVPEVRLLVAGDPIEPAEPLQELARQLRVADRIDWRLRFLAEDEIADVMEEAAVVVLPYRQIESSGVLATALGYGRAVVVTDVGSLGDTVRELDAGAVVSPEDPAAIAEACIQLLRQPVTIQTARGATWSWERSAEAHEDVYRELVAERA